jgi:hypothetical protein
LECKDERGIMLTRHAYITTVFIIERSIKMKLLCKRPRKESD